MSSIHKQQFHKRLAQKNPIVLDGGLATELENQGITFDTSLWSAQLLIKRPEAIYSVHKAYLEAGAEIITTASYQATLEKLIEHDLTLEQARNVLLASVNIACKARDDFNKINGNTAFVAASVGPYGAYLADGSEYQGNYGLSISKLESFHRQRLEILSQSNADLVACETIPDIVEAKALNNLLQSIDKPAWVSFSCKDSKHLNDGTPLSEAVEVFVGTCQVAAIGINCTAPEFVSDLITEISQSKNNQPIIVYPNSGETYCGNDKTWQATAEDQPSFAETSLQWVELGARIIGGCCRVGPNEISDMKRLNKRTFEN